MSQMPKLIVIPVWQVENANAMFSTKQLAEIYCRQQKQMNNLDLCICPNSIVMDSNLLKGGENHD